MITAEETPRTSPPTPIRLPGTTLRDCVRPRPPVDPNRGLCPSQAELDQARDDEPDDLADMILQALRRDMYVTAYFRARGVDLDAVVKGAWS